MRPTDPEVVVTTLLDAWNARDLDRFVELLAPDIEWYDPTMPNPPARGRVAVREFSETVLRAFPDFRYEIRRPVCVAPDGSKCAIHWQITATHSGPLIPPGFGPTGRTGTIEGVDVVELRGGMVVRVFTAFDALDGAEQFFGLQLRPRPGSARMRLLVTVQRLLAWRARGYRSAQPASTRVDEVSTTRSR